MIPQHLLEQIAQANDIVDVISSYFPLKRAGSAYKACCPFHHEKTPSFTVNPARQIFKCFGCGAGGPVFKFVEMYENVTFPEAVKRLAARVGIRVEEEPMSAEESAEYRLRQRLLALHAGAAEWFHTNLLRTKAAQSARAYLKSRGLTVDVAKSWKLGYAPDSWDALSQWARGAGYGDDEVIASGLVTWKEDEEGHRVGHFYDRFRDRLMFPICDKDTGEVIAFSGRVLNPEAFGGKYVNSPETPIFVKGKVLFGLQKTKRALIDKKAAIVCEGQIDLITAFEAGVQNITAPQGTAFTQPQAQILKRYVDEVILCFDSDAAGLKAAERSLPHLLGAGLSVRVAEMPAGHDPDSLIRTEGAEAFIRQIAQARDFFDFQIERAAATPEFATPRGKAAFAHKMAESVALVADPLLREAVIHNVSARLEMQPEHFVALLKAPTQPAWSQNSEEADAEPPPDEPRLAPLSNTTRILCRLALASPEVHAWLLTQPWEALFGTLAEAELLSIVMRGRYDPAVPATLASFLSTCDAEVQAVLAELLDAKMLPTDPLRQAADCWRDLERRDLERQRDAAAARMRTPSLDPEETLRLQQRVQELQQRILAMRS
jgi:DNA primase